MLRREESSRESSEIIRDTGRDVANRIARVTDEIGAACDRLGPKWQRIEDAIVEFGQDLDRPTSRVARAASDLSYEVKKSYGRIAGKRVPRRFAFWR